MSRNSGTPNFGSQVSALVEQLLGGPDTTPGIGDRVSEFAQSNPNESGLGPDVSDFAHQFLGGPDTAPAGGLALRDFINELRATPPEPDGTLGVSHLSDWFGV
jgi:hypothetical protein